MARASLAVCIISYNEEAKIGACLASVAWADECIVVDSGSQDRTREIAARAGARVIERTWPGHVEQKNFAADQARCDWVLGLDCDERVSPELRASIEAVLAGQGARDGYEVARKNRYLGRWWKRGGWYPSWRVRLWRKGAGRWAGENPHDCFEVDGAVGRLQGDLLHFTYDDLSDHLRTINSFTSIAAAAKRKRGRSVGLAGLLLRPAWTFFKKLILQGSWLEGTAGWIFSINASFYVFLKYAKLWESHHTEVGRSEASATTRPEKGESHGGGPGGTPQAQPQT